MDKQATRADLNEVRLMGRVSADPERRELPSGDTLWTLRLVVRRPWGASTGRTTVDTLELAVWAGRAQRSVATWRADDVVEVEGRLRRRFYAAPGQKASRVEVDVLRGRLIRRART